MPSLLNMPDVVMKLILKKSDYFSIQNLRKSCRDLRNFIDDVKPESKITKLFIHPHQGYVLLILTFLPGDKEKQIYYHDSDAKCVVRWKTEESWKNKPLVNLDFVDIACKDIQLLLDFSRIFKEIHFDLWSNCDEPTRFLNRLRRIVKSRSRLLQTLKLWMHVENSNQILNLLRFVDPKKLESIRIDACKGDNYDFSKIIELEQWKSAKELSVDGCKMNNSIESFLHFESINVAFCGLTADMVVILKKAFIGSPHMRHFELHHNQFDSFEKLIELFGEPFEEAERHVQWLFQIPEDLEHVLKVEIRSHFVTSFMRIGKNEVAKSDVL